MPFFRRAALATALALALAPAVACAQFTGAAIFGDSLSDAGQYGSRFTTNPGLTAAEYVTRTFGFVLTPSFRGGLDFAQGGVRVNAPSPLIPASAPNLSIAQQVTQLLSAGPLDPSALYQIQGGGNDLAVLGQQALVGQISLAQLQAGMQQAAADLVTQIARLQAAGARYVVVYTLPDAGRTPDAMATGQAANFTALSDLFNSTLTAGISRLRLNAIPVDTFRLIDEVTSNLSAFGFTNATSPACTTDSALTCTPSTLVAPNAAATYVFADGRHQTTAFNELIAAAAVATIQAPQQMAALAEAPLAVERSNFRAIDGRMLSSIGAPRPASKYDVWVTYDYSHPDMHGGFLDGDADQHTFTAGIDAKLSDALIVGGAFGYSENKGDFGSGGYKLDEPSGTLYAGYGMGPWYVGGSIGAGDLDYKDIRRTIQLGQLTRVESANANGSHLIGRVLGGYWFTYNNLLHGPFVKYTWQQISVRGFQEDGSDSTTLAFDEQKRHSSIVSAGWQASGTIGAMRPFARVLWENEFDDGERTVTASVPNVSSFTLPAYRVDNDWAAFDVGAAMDFGKVTGFLYGSGTAGKGDGNVWGVTVGVRVPL